MSQNQFTHEIVLDRLLSRVRRVCENDLRATYHYIKGRAAVTLDVVCRRSDIVIERDTFYFREIGIDRHPDFIAIARRLVVTPRRLMRILRNANPLR